MTSLLALCKPQNGPVTVKRIEISQPVQNVIGGIFQQQASAFLADVEDEIAFGGDYKPDADEILVLEAPGEIELMKAAVDNPIALDTVNAGNFANEPIKGVFVVVGEGENRRYLIQSFTAQQILSRNSLALIFQNNTFRELSEPSFTLDSKLVAIAENGRLKFKSFHFLKRIFVLENVYREASDQQVEAFCGHASLAVANVDAIKANSNQIVRRLIHAVQTSNVLDRATVATIQTTATSLGVALTVENGRIVVPTDRQQLKELLRFLDDAIYEGPLSAQRLLANSKRPFGVAT